jgi:predicted alpha/beta-fold hydrolase
VAFLEGSPAGKFYARYFLTSLKQKLRLKETMLAPLIDMEAALSSKLLSEFDDVATAPLHGFAGARDYYDQSSSVRFLDGIKVPTFLVHAKNDPFLPRKAIPSEAMAANSQITSAISRNGGHVGFVTGFFPGRAHFWAEGQIAAFLSAHLT